MNAKRKYTPPNPWWSKLAELGVLAVFAAGTLLFLSKDPGMADVYRALVVSVIGFLGLLGKRWLSGDW